MIGSGSFGHVYKAVKRIEGIFYAVKISKEKISKRTSHKMVQLNKEICALSVLGKSHQNLIRYYSSWIEEDRGKIFGNPDQKSTHRLKLQELEQISTF